MVNFLILCVYLVVYNSKFLSNFILEIDYFHNSTINRSNFCKISNDLDSNLN